MAVAHGKIANICFVFEEKKPGVTRAFFMRGAEGRGEETQRHEEHKDTGERNCGWALVAMEGYGNECGPHLPKKWMGMR